MPAPPVTIPRSATARAVAVLLAVAFVAAACGQKPGTRDDVVLDEGEVAAQQPGDAEPGSGTDGSGEDALALDDAANGGANEGGASDAAGDGDGDGDPGDGDGGDPGGEGVAGEPDEGTEAGNGGQPDGGRQPEGDTQSDDGASADTSSGDGEDRGAQTRGSDRTGVSDDTIRVGAHAPVTGAAPLPAPAFEEASDLYYRWHTEEQGREVLGRSNVEVTFANDQYQPSTAAQACRQLAANHFMLFGAGGTDQIQQCARLAEQGSIPYFSAGVTEAGLAGLDWYSALSMTYRAQGELLAQYVDRQYGDQRVAAVVTDTDNFDDAVQGWEAGVAQQGLDYFDTLRHPRGDTGWYTSFARQLAQNDVDVVYINSSPVDYLRFAQQASEQGYEPQFVGVGITMGLNPLLESGCPHVDGGEFFSPFPGLDWARDNEPEFFEAADRFGVTSNDIAFAIWAQSKQLTQIFDQYEARFGTDLTREDFRAFVEQTSVESDIFPPVSYSPDNNFGASQTHLLRADCADQEHKTVATFESSF